MAKPSANDKPGMPNIPQGDLFFILSQSSPIEERVGKVREVLERTDSRNFREEISKRVLQFVPVEVLVPESYKHWRSLVHDAMLFTMSHLSAGRLAPKIIDLEEPGY